jgi:hypothetical protein
MIDAFMELFPETAVGHDSRSPRPHFDKKTAESHGVLTVWPSFTDTSAMRALSGSSPHSSAEPHSAAAFKTVLTIYDIDFKGLS